MPALALPRRRSLAAALLALALLLAAGLVASPRAEASAAFHTAPPKVAGTRQVGKTLTVAFPRWSPTPTTKNYRWYRDGVPIAGATKPSYTLTSNDYGTTVVAKIAGHRDGYETAALGTIVGAIAPADGAKLVSRPTIDGIARAGVTLTATKGNWSLPFLSYGFSWFRNGVAINGATSQHYKVGSLDIGQRISVHVTVQKKGYRAAAAASAETAPAVEALVAFTGDGIKKVGRDVAPGTYYSVRVPDHMVYCTWSKLNSPDYSDIVKRKDGSLEDAYSSGPSLITVTSADRYIGLSDCGNWHRISSAGPSRSIIPSDGIWRVGVQVTPGTYQVSHAKECIYTSLKSADPHDVIDDKYSAPGKISTFVVKAGYYAIWTSNCGTWKRVK